MSLTGFVIESFGLSDIGLMREHNEDVWVTCPESNLFLLADGMGGHAAGEVAAKEAATVLLGLTKQWQPTKQTTPIEAVSFFREAIPKVNAHIFEHAANDSSLTGMGTTLCALFFFKGHAILTHVGDSRIYRMRGKQLDQLTEDHSLVAELVGLGAMKPHETGTYPYKHVLTRAVGTHRSVEPTVNYLLVEEGDLFMLCSDGLTNMVADEEIAGILDSELALCKKSEALIELANERGGGDNITTVLVEVKGVDLPR